MRIERGAAALFADDVAQEVFDLVVEEAREADERALLACQRSKYSIQDYWMCVEMRMANLANRIARKHYLPVRCPIFSYRMALNEFRKSQVKLLTFEEPVRVRQQGLEDT